MTVKIKGTYKIVYQAATGKLSYMTAAVIARLADDKTYVVCAVKYPDSLRVKTGILKTDRIVMLEPAEKLDYSEVKPFLYVPTVEEMLKVLAMGGKTTQPATAARKKQLVGWIEVK